jgi:hypothetical protein
MSRNLILSVHWEDGDPDDSTKAMAERQRHAGHRGRGLVVSFAEAVTREEGFDRLLAQLDVGEVLNAPFYPEQEPKR